MSLMIPELVSVVASFMPLDQVGRTAPVCKGWNRGVDQMWKGLLADLPTLDAVFWRSVGVEVEDVAPPEQQALLRAMKQICPSVETPGGDPRRVPVTRIVIPAGLTINRLLEIARENNVPIGRIWDGARVWLGNVPVSETYQALVTNSVLIGSRYRPYDQQEPLLKVIGCVAIPTLEALALLIATYIDTGRRSAPVRLCGDNPWTYFRDPCSIEDCQVHIGGFDRKGPTVHSHSRYAHDHDSVGVGGLRKF